jgi:hypothetical protein
MPALVSVGLVISLWGSRQGLAGLAPGLDNLFHQRGVTGASTKGDAPLVSSPSLTVIGHIAYNQFRYINPPNLVFRHFAFL